jgi:hypothetical protein
MKESLQELIQYIEKILENDLDFSTKCLLKFITKRLAEIISATFEA